MSSRMMAIIAAAAARRGSGGTDADAQDFFDRVSSNSGTLSSGTQTAVSAFVASAKSNGYWSLLSRFNPMCGDWSAAVVPLIVGGGGDTDASVGYSSADYSESTGLVGAGTNTADTGHFINTGYSAAADDPSDWGCFVYVSGVPTSNTYYMGVAKDSGPDSYSGVAQITTNLLGFIGCAAGESASSTGPTSGDVGFAGIVANGSRTSTLYRNGSSVGSPVTASAAFLPNNILVASRNHVGGTQFFPMRSNQSLRGYAITKGLTATQVADFSADLNAFQTALGRNVY